MENIWLVSIAALVVGTIIGFLMGRSTGSNNKQAELAEQLENAQQDLESYRAEVAEHFEKTASLVNNLTNSYKDVHEHLASGAQGLCQPGTIDLALEPAMTPNKLEKSEAAEATPEAGSETDTAAEPPRDYAPKAPEEEGTLSETFGLKEEKDQNEEEAPTEQPISDAPLQAEEEKVKPA